jgi:hypothetical protein
MFGGVGGITIAILLSRPDQYYRNGISKQRYQIEFGNEVKPVGSVEFTEPTNARMKYGRFRGATPTLHYFLWELASFLRRFYL